MFTLRDALVGFMLKLINTAGPKKYSRVSQKVLLNELM